MCESTGRHRNFEILRKRERENVKTRGIDRRYEKDEEDNYDIDDDGDWSRVWKG